MITKHLFFFLPVMISIFLVFLPLNAYTQTQFIKGKVLALPVKGISAAAISFGFEKIFNSKHSASILLHFSQYGSGDYDGSVHSTSKISPEYRYYFKNKDHPASSKYFMGIFTEFTRAVQKYGGEQSGPEIKLSKRCHTVDPGFLFGKNFKLSSKWHLETYLGPKLRIVSAINKSINGGAHLSRNENSILPGVKAGFNLAFRL